MFSKKQILIPVLILLFIQAGRTQDVTSDHINKDDRAASIQAHEKAAQKAFNVGDYATAMYRYKQLVDIDTLRTTALMGYGTAALRANALEKAEWAFQTMIDRHLTGPDGQALLSLADVKYRLGKYDEAKKWYTQFLADEKIKGVSSKTIEEVQTNIENCEWALKVKPSTLLKTPLMLLDTGTVNTSYSEFSPYPIGDSLYFSSYRFPFDKDTHYPKRRLIKVLTATQNPKDGKLEATPANFNEENKHTAHVTFNEKEDVMYYTECHFINATEIQCDLYQRRRKPDHTWGIAEKLPEYINKAGTTTTEPSVGRGPGEKNEVLYFVSDRPGGKGKRDLWYSTIWPDSLGRPINLEALNTTGDDVTPFYHAATNTLYFSTDGRQTMGGLDVYQSQGTAGKTWSAPEHLGTPINSGYNDVYFAVNRPGSVIFMASNRRGDQNASEEACCYDLYKADLIAPKMIAIAFNKVTGDSLRGTVMRLIEIGPDGKIVSDKPYTVTGPSQKFELQPGKKYMIIGAKDRFISDTTRFETPRVIWQNQMVQKLYLTPEKVDLVVTVLDRETKQPILGSTAIFSELPSGAYGRPVSEPKMETHTADNQYKYALQFDRNYKVVVSKEGYSVDSTGTVSTEGLKHSTTIRDTLYLTRGVAFKAHTIDAIEGKRLYGVTYKLYDLTDKKVVEYISPIGKDFQTVLAYDHRYMLTGSKADYTSDTVVFTTLKLPKKEFQTIERELRLRPLDITKYLPVVLYFDNDEPDKRCTNKTTDREYRATYVDYIRKKEEFIREYTEGMPADQAVLKGAEIDTFFERDVRGGWNRLMAFSEVLYDMMTRGDSIELTLKGYASPRAATNYNLWLTDRRVSSVYNHFDIFDGGIYKKFVKKQLFFNREPNGESKAPHGISDDIKDPKNSLYDIRASRERRVEIIGVKVNKDKKL
jgi:tetratricopeptide (TPR) repeat protein